MVTGQLIDKLKDEINEKIKNLENALKQLCKSCAYQNSESPLCSACSSIDELCRYKKAHWLNLKGDVNL